MANGETGVSHGLEMVGRGGTGYGAGLGRPVSMVVVRQAF